MSILGRKIKLIVKRLDENGGHYFTEPDNKIEICPDQTDFEIIRVLTHEFNHGVMDIASLNDAVKDGVDEIIVNQFAKAYRECFVLIPKGVGDTVVKHYAVYSAYGDLVAFHTEESIKHRPLHGKDEVVVELQGVTKFKRKVQCKKNNTDT